MSLFTGNGAHPGVAIAAAARLKVEYGVASFEPERLRRIAARLRAFGVESPEPDQVILVADTLPSGLVPASVGLEVIGLAVGAGQAALAPNVPAVFGLGGDFFESVAEDEIVIVDGSRGRAYLSPDAATVARYQMPTRSARRIFLDEGHLAARTATDGRAVAVFCPAILLGDVDEAMAAGADGIYLPPQSLLLGSPDHPMAATEQQPVWDGLYRKTGGLPLLVAVSHDRLSMIALARGASHGPLHLVVGDQPTRDEIGAQLAAAEGYLDNEDAAYGTTLFELALTIDSGMPPDDLEGFAGILIPENDAGAGMERLLPLASCARAARRALTLALGAAWREVLPSALALGAQRVIVPGEDAAEAKDAIRAW